MNRRNLLTTGAAAGLASLVSAESRAPEAKPLITGTGAEPLTPPAKGSIEVAIALAPGAVMIDFAGPWEVFQDVHVMDRGPTMEEMMPFRLHTVAATPEVVETSGGMKVVPEYTFETAPPPRVVVVPALEGNPELHDWLREVSRRADLTMSVCTGAFQLAEAGLLDGLMATTHHASFDRFEERYPKVRLQRGVRLVDNGRIATAGGLSSGIDLALHVVERYFGTGVAEWTAAHMEYTGSGWRSQG